LVPDKSILQCWHLDDWPEKQYSKVSFKLEPVESGTRITLPQTGVPENAVDDVE
jgi:activator of HSP90 ATPase